MNRGEAMAEVSGRYSTVITDAAVDDAWLDYVVNDALRAIGTAQADLATKDVADSSVPAYIAALQWAFWKGIADVYAPRVDTAMGAGALDTKRSQAYAHAVQQRDRAETALATYGYAPALATAVIQRVSARDPYGVRDGILLGQTF